MPIDFNKLTLDVAKRSTAKKRKVGATLATTDGYASAWNHRPKGGACETPTGETYHDVVHAEVAAILEYKRLNTTIPKGSTLYTTHPPCANCQQAIQRAEITKVIIVEEFMKFDTDKLRFELIPPRVEESLAKVLTYGAKKYKPENWRKGSIERYEAALLRHINAYRQGEACDKESGLLHLEHALCNVVFLLELHADKDKVK